MVQEALEVPVAAGSLEEVEVQEASKMLVAVEVLEALEAVLVAPASQSTQPSTVSICKGNIADCMESRIFDHGIHCNMTCWEKGLEEGSEQGTKHSGAWSLRRDTIHSMGNRSDLHSGYSTIRLIAEAVPEMGPVHQGVRPL